MPQLCDLNGFLTCAICNGYLIKATTITECLHTFCKSCLVIHLGQNDKCPTCQAVVHPTNPLQGILPDNTKQEIVYKLVPNLRGNERERERVYNGWPIEPPEDDFDLEATDDVSYRDDADQVIVCLMPMQKYIRCSADATMIHLKKFVDVVDYENMDVFCCGALIGNNQSIKFVLATIWKGRKNMLHLDIKPNTQG